MEPTEVSAQSWTRLIEHQSLVRGQTRGRLQSRSTEFRLIMHTRWELEYVRLASIQTWVMVTKSASGWGESK